MLEVEPRVSRYEQVSLAPLVTKAPDSVVARSMSVVGGVVPDDGFQVPDLEGGVSHAVKAFRVP